MALFGIPLTLLVLGRPWPPNQKHLALILWVGWLLPAVVYFSLNSGLWHAYYLIMLGPPLAALVAITAWALWQLIRRRRLLGLAALGTIAGVTLLVQFHALGHGSGNRTVLWVAALPLLLGGMALLVWASRRGRQSPARIGLGLSILSLVLAPLVWSGLTAFNEHPNVALPRSGPDAGQAGPMPGAPSPAQEAILDFLLEHTDPGDYLVAGLSSHDLSGFIIATGRPALTFGGFNGRDNVVKVEELAEMVGEGKLRYVLGGQELARTKPKIWRWVESSCTIADAPGLAGSAQRRRPILYDCGG
jgi:4-amino-4-deoxy-L-arabinose transferase-like glycosyltransferase